VNKLRGAVASAFILLGGCTPSFNHAVTASTLVDTPCVETDYTKAMKFAARSLEILNRFDRRQEGIRLTEGAAALAIGTTAAGVAGFGGGKDLLRGLAIGGATVLGVETLLTPATKMSVVNTGRKALYCAMRAAKASQFSSNTYDSAVASSYNGTRGFNELLNGIAEKSTGTSVASAMAAQRHFLGVKSSPGRYSQVYQESPKGEFVTDEATLGMFQVVKAADAQVRQENALTEFAIEMSVAEASAGADLSAAVCEINDKIAAELRSATPNVQSILDAQKQVVESQIGKLVQAEQEAEEAADDTATTGTQDPANCKPGDASCKAKALAYATHAAAAEAAPAKSAYEDCINPVPETED
jgi:hypothetical protein